MMMAKIVLAYNKKVPVVCKYIEAGKHRLVIGIVTWISPTGELFTLMDALGEEHIVKKSEIRVVEIDEEN
ncbi:CooT family nickel-binding protein [Cytobacillus firmus]|nr:CooT family nickel-binding protein [Cytobacillus firmus]